MMGIKLIFLYFLLSDGIFTYIFLYLYTYILYIFPNNKILLDLQFKKNLADIRKEISDKQSIISTAEHLKHVSNKLYKRVGRKLRQVRLRRKICQCAVSNTQLKKQIKMNKIIVLLVPEYKANETEIDFQDMAEQFQRFLTDINIEYKLTFEFVKYNGNPDDLAISLKSLENKYSRTPNIQYHFYTFGHGFENLDRFGPNNDLDKSVDRPWLLKCIQELFGQRETINIHPKFSGSSFKTRVTFTECHSCYCSLLNEDKSQKYPDIIIDSVVNEIFPLAQSWGNRNISAELHVLEKCIQG